MDVIGPVVLRSCHHSSRLVWTGPATVNPFPPKLLFVREFYQGHRNEAGTPIKMLFIQATRFKNRVI